MHVLSAKVGGDDIVTLSLDGVEFLSAPPSQSAIMRAVPVDDREMRFWLGYDDGELNVVMGEWYMIHVDAVQQGVVYKARFEAVDDGVTYKLQTDWPLPDNFVDPKILDSTKWMWG